MASKKVGSLTNWICSRGTFVVVGSAAVLSSVIYVLYRYYCSRTDNDLSKDEGFVDTAKVCIQAVSTFSKAKQSCFLLLLAVSYRYHRWYQCSLGAPP